MGKICQQSCDKATKKKKCSGTCPLINKGGFKMKPGLEKRCDELAGDLCYMRSVLVYPLRWVAG